MLAVLFWGGSFIATKLALREVSPVTVVWLRFAFGLGVLGIAVALRRQWAPPQRSQLGYYALLGFIGITFHQWLQSTGLQTSHASTTAWIVATTPIFMALLGWLVLKERLFALQIAGICLAAFGVILVVTEGDLSAMLSGGFGAPGDLLILLSAPNWAVFSILARRGLQQQPAARMLFYVMAFGWLFTTILFLAGSGLGELSKLSATGWLAIAFLGLFCSGLAYIFWFDALQVIPASRVGALVYLEPLVTVGVAAALLGEPILLAALLGGALILLGVWLVEKK
jgi:drug/metabolite transporter (DMT)-like permease